jgi:hypothetical protein
MKNLYILFVSVILCVTNSFTQVLISLNSEPTTPVNGTTVIINGNSNDAEVNAYMSVKHEFTESDNYTIKIVKELSDPAIDQFCSGICVQNTANARQWTFPIPIYMNPSEFYEFKPGYVPNGNTFCAINHYYIENEEGVKIDSVTVKFVIGASECFLSTPEIVKSSKETKLFPNPSTGLITIKDAPENSTITIVDMLGKELVKDVALSSTQQLNLSNLPDGVYFYTIRQKNGVLLPAKKLILQK